jgi:isoleucyl-tRNA synthetase
MYRGHKVVPYCPRCGTPLSSHEVSQGYADVTDPSVTIRMRVKGEEGRSFLAWTTTPWTLPANAAIAVAPGETYVEVERGGERLILAEARLPHVFRETPTVTRTFRGAELVGMRYERLFPYAEEDERAWRVIAGDFVSLEDGTGIVHIAPAYGEDDYRVGRTEGLPVISLVDETGRFVAAVKEWAGRPVKEADGEIIRDLDARGLLFARADVVHSYPHCWRCATPLLYYARESWFIRTTAYRDRLVEENAKIDWYPPETGRNRFGRWLENNVDWCLSRDRYWGTPLNIWECGSCAEAVSVGSVADLRALSAAPLPEPIDLHRPWADAVQLRCPKCGGPMKRVPEVIDVWFDSGCMPYAQYHFPFDERKMFEDQFPADFICEGTDQTRGWFHSLLAIATHVSGRSSYRSCFGIGLVLDEEGKKMSKSKGNVVDPWEILEGNGADALRWYLIWAAPLWLPRRFSVESVREVGYRFLDTLRNTLSFFLLYASLDRWVPGARGGRPEGRTDMDRWILSRLETTTREATACLDRYDLMAAARAFHAFVIDDLSNWYVRRNRRRFWKGELDAEKSAAFETLYEVLVSLSKLLAPIVPFVSEEIWGALVRPFFPDEPESVHLAAYPVCREERIDADLEASVDLSREAVNLGRAIRMRVSLKTRQPVRTIAVAVGDPEAIARLGRARETVREELNARALEIVADEGAYLLLAAKPLFPVLGPRFGRRAGKVAEAIRALPSEAVRRIRAEGEAPVDVEGESVAVSADCIEVEERGAGSYAMERGERLAVFLDTALDEDLLEEGLAREFVHKIQALRKDAGFEVADRIHVAYEGSDRLARAVERHAEQIRYDTLAASLRRGEPGGERTEECDLNGEPARVAVTRVSGEEPGTE